LLEVQDMHFRKLRPRMIRDSKTLRQGQFGQIAPEDSRWIASDRERNVRPLTKQAVRRFAGKVAAGVLAIGGRWRNVVLI
jgi:hypothetical protein